MSEITIYDARNRGLEEDDAEFVILYEAYTAHHGYTQEQLDFILRDMPKSGLSKEQWDEVYNRIGFILNKEGK